nr:unnamed protein product [Digitaria exilis]
MRKWSLTTSMLPEDCLTLDFHQHDPCRYLIINVFRFPAAMSKGLRESLHLRYS